MEIDETFEASCGEPLQFHLEKKGKYKIMYTWIMNNIYTVNSFNFVENRIGLCNDKRVRLECGRSWVL